MAVLRAVLTLRLGFNGWQEEYFLDPDGPALLAVGRRLCAARALVSSPPTVIESFHVAPVLQPRHGAAAKVNIHCNFRIQSEIFKKTANLYVLDLDVAVVMYFRTANGAQRCVTITGVPQLPVNPLTFPTPGMYLPMYLKQLDGFRDALLDPLLRLVIKEEKPPDDDTAAYVESIDVDPHGRYRLRLVNSLPLPPNALVRCNGSTGRNLGRLRGLRRVRARLDDRTIVLDKGPVPDLGPLVYQSRDMLVRSVSYQYSPAVWVPSGERAVTFDSYFIDDLPWFKATAATIVNYHFGSRHRGALRTRRRGRKRKTDPLA